ncbi:MAG: fibronectin type III domain-containing protein, partial [Gemmatimonadota bacterium]
MSDSRSAGSTVAGASHAAAATPLVVLALAVLLLIAACSHDAPRQNPLDPELTPAVELQAALDDSAGTVTLSWTPYSGPQPFAACYVQRRVQGQEAWADLDTLLTAAEPGFVDSSLAPATAYEYRVVVVNAGGYQAPSNRESVAGYSVGAVELLAPEPVPDSGLVRLRWTRYRDPGFQAYRLLRRPVGSDRDTTLFVSAARGDTVAVDTDAFHQVTYTYRVQVEGPGQALVSNAREARLDLRAVPLRPLVLDPSTATARLAWSAYSGPRFDSYVVERRAEGFEPTVVRVLGDRAMTTAADTLPLGDTRYLYRVVVHTTRGEEVTGPELSGIIYRHVADLPLDLAAGDYVRLYAELDGRVAALVAGARGIRLRFYGSGGRQEEQVLYTVAVDRPRTISTAHGDPGVRLVSAAFDTVLALLHYDLDGQLLRQYDPLDFGQPLGPLTSDQQQVAPVVTLVSGVSDNYSSTVWVDAVTVSRDGQVLWQEGFDASPAGAAPWFYLGSEVTVSGGFAR